MAMARAAPACFRGSRTPSPRTRSLVLAGYSVAALGEARLRRSGPSERPQEHLSPAPPPWLPWMTGTSLQGLMRGADGQNVGGVVRGWWLRIVCEPVRVNEN
jgi:hypothetical protein